MKKAILIPYHSHAGVVTNSSSEIFCVSSNTATPPELESLVESIWQENRGYHDTYPLEDVRAFAGVKGLGDAILLCASSYSLDFDDAERMVQTYLREGERFAISLRDACGLEDFDGEIAESGVRRFLSDNAALLEGRVGSVAVVEVNNNDSETVRALKSLPDALYLGDW